MKLCRLMLLLPFTILHASNVLLGYSEGPIPQVTGGFKEATCVMCHNSFSLNQGRTRGGIFQIIGVPKTYTAGATYPIKVLIGQPGQSRWGFELSARHIDSGRQAGRLVPLDKKTQVKEKDGIQYIEHNLAGTRQGTPDGPVEFEFNWIVSDSLSGPILFNAAGNAANSDGDTSGDFVYTAGAYTTIPGAPTQISSTLLSRSRDLSIRRRQTSKVMNLPSPVDLNRGSSEIHIQHRFLQPISQSRPGNAFGVDFGANINLGINVALTDRLSFGVSRVRFDQIIALTGTYEIQTDDESFWKMSFLGGVEGQRNFEEHYSTFLQLPTSLDYKALRLHFVPTMIFNSRKDELLQNPFLSSINPGDNHTFALGIGADFALTPKYAILFEYVSRLAGFGGFQESDHASISGGFEIRTRGHVFSILLSSSRDFTPATYGVNAGQDDVSLGFNIYRRMR